MKERTPEQLARLVVIRAEMAELTAGIDNAYWTFTRCARGVPPSMAVPHLYARRTELETELAGIHGMTLREWRGGPKVHG